jgi:hypothetical protein
MTATPAQEALLNEVRAMRRSFDRVAGALVFMSAHFGHLDPAHVWSTVKRLVDDAGNRESDQVPERTS